MIRATDHLLRGSARDHVDKTWYYQNITTFAVHNNNYSILRWKMLFREIRFWGIDSILGGFYFYHPYTTTKKKVWPIQYSNHSLVVY